MRIKTHEATAAQLRAYYKELTGQPIHETASRANVMRRLENLGPVSEVFELPDDFGAAPEPEPAPDPDEPLSPETLLKALMGLGVEEESARKLAGLTVATAVADNANRKGGTPYGKGKENLWVVIQIARTEDAGGDEPVPTGVNGVIQYLPRGERIPVRTPFLEVLRHAERIVYDQVVLPDGITMSLRKRFVSAYPLEYVSQELYPNRKAAEAAIAA